MATYEIPTARLDYLQVKFAQLDRKAKSIGLEPMTYKILEKKIVEKKNPKTLEKYLEEVVVLETFGKPPIINGWKFVAVIEHEEAGNIIKNISSDEIPTKYRTRSAVCDHCKLKRLRKDTYLLRKIGTLDYKQVGRSCLKDFTGHDDPISAADTADMYSDLVDSLKESEEWFGGGSSGIHDLTTYLSYVIATIRKSGWVSRKDAELSYGVASTADVAEFWIEDVARDKRTEQPTDEDKEKAKKVVEWASKLTNIKNDFIHNIHVLAKQNAVKIRDIGIAAASVIAYDRAMAETRLIEGDSQYLGKVGDRDNFIVKLINVFTTESTYGALHIYNFQDEKGNVLVWMSTTKQDMEDGKIYNLACTIKDHKEFRGIKQTQLTRCKIMPLGEQITETQKKTRISAQQSKARKEEKAKQKADEDYHNYTIEYSEPYEKNVLHSLSIEIASYQERIDDLLSKYGKSDWAKETIDKSAKEIAKREIIIDDFVQNTVEKIATIKDGSKKAIRVLRIFNVNGTDKYVMLAYVSIENHPYNFHELKNESFEDFIKRTHMKVKDLGI